MNVYDKAIESLQRDGWTQNAARGSLGQRCMGQAIYHAFLGADTATDMVQNAQALDALMFVSLRVPALANHSVVIWNDTPGRTYDEVIAALKVASIAWDVEQAEARAEVLTEAPTLEFMMTMPEQPALTPSKVALAASIHATLVPA